MQVLQGISQIMKSVSGSGSMDDFQRVSSGLVQLKDKVREALQAATAEDVTKILKKLEHQETLTPEERNLVRLWIVGDAEGYIKMENDFSEWLVEFRRLGGVLESYAGQATSPQSLVEVHGVLEDAIRLTADISYFLEKKDRVERFNSAINNLTPEDAKFLADMMRSMLSSPEM
jgi:predicted Zn-dependent peptidase